MWNWRKHTSENLHGMVLGGAEDEIYCWMWNKPQNKKQSSDEKRGQRIPCLHNQCNWHTNKSFGVRSSILKFDLLSNIFPVCESSLYTI